MAFNKLLGITNTNIKRRNSMGTRGCYGFRKDRIDKLSYNHMDSYPSELGVQIAEYCRDHSFTKMAADFDAIGMVDQESMPTAKQQKVLGKYFKKVGTGRADDWYALLRGTQGDIAEAAKCGFMIDNHKFMLDSLFCEWAYVVNLDTGMLEVYKGFQGDGDKVIGRYKGEQPASPSKYWGVSLVAKIPFSDPDIIEKVLATEQDEDEE